MKMRMLKYQSQSHEVKEYGDSFSVKHTFRLPSMSYIRKIAFQKHGYADLDIILTMWCEVDPDVTELENVEIMLIPTGGTINNDNWYFFDTIFINDLVFHIYEVDTSAVED